MQSLVICSANADAGARAQIRKYVEVNCSHITLHDDISWAAPNEMLEAVESALSADITLVLASPDAIPPTWSRRQWESVLVEQPAKERTALAFILLRACRLPEVLRKKNFFDLSTNWDAGAYSLRRRLFEHNPLKQERWDSLPPDPQSCDVSEVALRDLESRICCFPGTADNVPRAVALALARKHYLNFESVLWVNCVGRSLAGVIGDTAHALGMKLTGPAEVNVAALRVFCVGPRVLYVFDQLDAQYRGAMNFAGCASVIFTAMSDVQTYELTIAESLELFRKWRANPNSAATHVSAASQHIQLLDSGCSEETAADAKDLGGCVFQVLQFHERWAEALEIAQVLSRRAWLDGDRSALERWEREKSWILHSWGLSASAGVRLGGVPSVQQLTFGFESLAEFATAES